MGYEVLDASGSAGGLDHPLRRINATPFALDAPESPDPLEPRRIGLQWPGGRRMAAAVFLLLVVGGAVGAGWQRHLSDQAEQVRARAVARVAAIMTGLEVLPAEGGGSRVEYSVQLSNLGPLPVDLATDAGAANATFSRPQVSLLKGLAVLQPGKFTVARVSFLADCTSSVQRTQTVSVRSKDGRLHRVPLLNAQEITSEGDNLSEKQMCEQSSGQDVTVNEDLTSTLTGRFDRPVVTLNNSGAKSLTVESDPGMDPLTTTGDEGGPGLEIRTRPALPVRIPAKGSVRLRLMVEVGECRHLPDDLTLDQYPTTLSVQATELPDNQDTSTQVDLRSIVATALDHACP